MDKITVKVSGAKTVQLSLRYLVKEVGDLRVMQQIAAEGAKLASHYAPKRSGRLAISIRGNKAKRKAVVTAGKGFSRNYAGRINYGDRKHHIKPAGFMQRASRTMEPRAHAMLDRELGRLIKYRNFR